MTLRTNPADLDAIRDRMAAGMCARAIAAELGLTRKAVLNRAYKHKLGKWLSMRGVEAGLTIPADFVAFYLANGHARSAKRYGVNPSTITNWARIKDVRRRTPKPLTSATVKRWQARHKPTMTAIVRDESIVGRAADYLRQFGPVYRCRVTGGAEATGSHWSRGSAILTDDQLIERADWMRSRERRAA